MDGETRSASLAVGAAPQRTQTRVLRIGLDGTALSGCTGVTRYVWEMCKALDRLIPQAKFFVYSPVSIDLAPLAAERWIIRAAARRLWGPFAQTRWYMLHAGRQCREDSLDVFWATATLAPPVGPRIKIVSSVYDVNYLLVPKTMALGTLLSHLLFFKSSLRRAAAISAISYGTAQRVSDFFGLDTATVANPAVSGAFYPRSQEEIEACIKGYAITRPYLLAVGTREPRKNLQLLVRTFRALKRDGLLARHRLVLVGPQGWKHRRLNRLLSSTDPADIASLGYVPDDDLARLYSGADAFVFPSIYEGFGLPILEAQSCGTRVVTSDTPELREAGGSDAIYAFPDEEHLRKSILQAISTPPRRLRAGVGLCSWEGEAAKLAAVICRVAGL